MSKLLEGLPLVAHDKNIDELHLRAVFQLHGMEYPGYKFYDTLEPSRKAFPNLPNHKLSTVAAQCGYQMTQSTTPSVMRWPARGWPARYCKENPFIFLVAQ